MPHGLATSLTLDAVSRLNEGHYPDNRRLFHLFREYGGVGPWIDLTCEGVIRMRLSEFGIISDHLPRIVGHAFTAGRMDNNPVSFTEDDVLNILRSVL